MSRITKAQFSSLLIISDIFVIFCLRGEISALTAAGFLTGCVFQYILAIPLIRISESGKTAKFIIFLWLIIWGAELFCMLWRTSDVIFIPYESQGIFGKILTGGLISVVCVYISSTGIKAISRAGVISAALWAFCAAIFIITSVFNSDFENIRHAGEKTSLSGEILRGMILSGNAGAFVVLIKHSEDNIYETARFYFSIKMLSVTAMLLAAVLTVGGIMPIAEFPVVMAAQITQPFPVQRIDALFLIVFSVFGVFSVGLQSTAASAIIKEIIPSFRRYRSNIILFLMMMTALFIY